MISVYSVLFTLVLFSELSSTPVAVAVAVPVGDGIVDPDGLGPLMSAEPAAVVPLNKRGRVMDVRDEDGSPKIIILSDTRLRGQSNRGLIPAFPRGLPLLTDRSLSRTPAEYSLKVDRRDTDLDMLRCMIGRVYRPCWEV